MISSENFTTNAKRIDNKKSGTQTTISTLCFPIKTATQSGLVAYIVADLSKIMGDSVVLDYPLQGIVLTPLDEHQEKFIPMGMFWNEDGVANVQLLKGHYDLPKEEIDCWNDELMKRDRITFERLNLASSVGHLISDLNAS